MEEIDVYRAANLLIGQHGADGALIHAAQRVDELLAEGDMDGRRVWMRVLAAVRELTDTKPPEAGARVH